MASQASDLAWIDARIVVSELKCSRVVDLGKVRRIACESHLVTVVVHPGTWTNFDHKITDRSFDDAFPSIWAGVESCYPRVARRGLVSCEECRVVHRDLVSQVVGKISQRDAAVVEDLPALSIDDRVWVVNPDVHLLDLGLYKPACTGNLGVVPRRAGLKSRKHDAILEKSR